MGLNMLTEMSSVQLTYQLINHSSTALRQNFLWQNRKMFGGPQADEVSRVPLVAPVEYIIQAVRVRQRHGLRNSGDASRARLRTKTFCTELKKNTELNQNTVGCGHTPTPYSMFSKSFVVSSSNHILTVASCCWPA